MRYFERIFLHIGPHKTGTSAIQLVCDENRAALQTENIYYPLGRWHGQLGSCFAENKVTYVYNRHMGNINESDIIASDKDYLGTLDAEFTQQSCHTLVLSYEGFIDLNSREIFQLRDFLFSCGKRVTIIGYCRHPLSFAPSEISQRCRMGVPTGRTDSDNPPIPKFQDYFHKFELAFGNENVVLTEFGPSTLQAADVRIDFLLRIGLNESSLTKVVLSDVRINESLSAEAILIGEAIAKKLPPFSRGNFFYLRFNELLDSIHGVTYKLSAEESVRILDAAVPHLNYLKTNFGLVLTAPRQDGSKSEIFGEVALNSLAEQFIQNDPVVQAYRWLFDREPSSEEDLYRLLRLNKNERLRLRTDLIGHSERGTNLHQASYVTYDFYDSTSERAGVPCTDVTVCMIVMNEEEFIHQSLSAMAQVFCNFIILDMGSTDNTLKLSLDILGSKLTIIHYHRNKLLKFGYSHARNFCSRHATTDWVLMVDADEVLISGVENGNISLDCSQKVTGLASVKRENLFRPETPLPNGVKLIEHPRRLYRNYGMVSWSGYIHEEAKIDTNNNEFKVSNSSLEFNHLSALREPSRIQAKQNMYRWMLLRAYKQPDIRGGTNSWWYDKFVPENIELVNESALEFEKEFENGKFAIKDYENNGNVQDILDSWGTFFYGIPLCDLTTLSIQFNIVPFNEANEWCEISGQFDSTCEILIDRNMANDGKKVKINRIGKGKPISNAKIVLLKINPELIINIDGDNARIFVGRIGSFFAATINVWRNGSIFIGDRATCNGARIVVDEAIVIIGRDSMLSDEILIQSNDQHGLIDIDSMGLVNGARRKTLIGEHVWVGRRAIVMADVSLGSGCIVGSGAVVTSDVESCSICGGAPARVIRQRMSWSRSPAKISEGELNFVRHALPQIGDIPSQSRG